MNPAEKGKLFTGLNGKKNENKECIQIKYGLIFYILIINPNFMNKSAWLITFIYFTLSFLWILFSDDILLSIESDPIMLSKIQTYKGWIFVFLSSVLIYFLTSKSIKKFITANHRKSKEIKNLTEIKNKLQLSVEASKIGFWEWELSTNKVFFSKEWKRQIGFKDKEVPNTYEEWEKRVHPDDIDELNKTINQFIHQEADQFYKDFRFKHKSGHYIWISANAIAIKNKDGEIEKLIGSHLDITPRKEVEEKLKEKEKQLSNLIGNLKGIVYRCKNDANWTMTFLSKGIEKVTGYNPEDLIDNKNLAYADLIVPEDRQKVLDEIQQALNVNRQFRITYRIKTKNNEEKWVWEQGVGVYDEKKQLIRLEGFIADITEQKLAEIALQKSEQKYKNLVENSLVGIYTTNIDGKLIYANKAFCNILGYKNSEEINIKDLYPSKERREKLINEIKHNQIVSNYETQLLTKQGEIKNITLNASLNGDEISGMMLDITHIKEYEKQLLMAKEDAEKASKIKDAFIGNVSHEIRTPLNAINGFTNILKNNFEKHIDDRSNEFFQIIFNASSRLERTVDMMLDFSKLNADDMEMKPLKVDFKQIIKRILEEHQVEIKKKNLEIIIEQNTENTQIIADEYAIENAFSNIIQNAIKYTEKGHVKISCSHNEKDDLIIHVEDTGIGMTRDYLENIFTPYSQEDTGYTRQYEGIGLGLSITKKLLELNGAEIRVKSEKEKGSVFSVIFKNEFQKQVKEFSKPNLYVSNK
ncbi:MAG: PAS domain-containing protein [Bacteroidales bacterium]